MAHAAVRDHKGDYGIDGSFHTVSARGQAIGVARKRIAALSPWEARDGAPPSDVDDFDHAGSCPYEGAQLGISYPPVVVIDSTAGNGVEPQWDATIGTAPGEWAVVRHA
ncbi:MAG: hypothetical protein ACRDTV_21005 [Mycobacterium sp.]